MSPFLLSFILSIITIKAQQTMLLHLLKNEAGSQCIDGSPAGFYYSPPPSGKSDLWVIELKGGGACYDKESCTQRANTSLGSSKNWPKTREASSHGDINSNDPNKNPDFYSAHQIYAPYCSGDIWGGQRKTPSTDPDTWGFVFNGHLIFTQIIQYLAYNISNGSIYDANYILLTGGSAGGIGTIGNTNWLYNEMKNIRDNITVKAAPVAGWFFPGNTTDQLSDPMMPPNDFPHWLVHKSGGPEHDDSMNILYDGYLDPNCVKGLGEKNAWHCGSAHNLYPFIEAPIFILENKFDSNQITSGGEMPTNVVNNDTIGYVEYYGIDMDRSILTQLIDEKNDKNGLYYASCFNHADLTFPHSGVRVNGYQTGEIVGDWFWERNKLPHFVYDTCNNDTYKLPCNPTCNPYPPTSVNN
eukprot:396814_1